MQRTKDPQIHTEVSSYRYQITETKNSLEIDISCPINNYLPVPKLYQLIKLLKQSTSDEITLCFTDANNFDTRADPHLEPLFDELINIVLTDKPQMKLKIDGLVCGYLICKVLSEIPSDRIIVTQDAKVMVFDALSIGFIINSDKFKCKSFIFSCLIHSWILKRPLNPADILALNLAASFAPKDASISNDINAAGPSFYHVCKDEINELFSNCFLPVVLQKN